MVEMKRLVKGYQKDEPVLNGLDLQVKKGEFVYVVGETGAGKTTLLKLLATEELPNAGELFLFGYPSHRVTPAALKAIRRSIGYIPQDIRLIPDLSVVDNILMGYNLALRRSIAKATQKQLDELLEQLNLTHCRDHMAHSLSGGEAQRVAIARALIRKPELILADEPTGAQDRKQGWQIMDLLTRAHLQGATVLVATHDAEMTRRVRKRTMMLERGQVRSEDPICIF